jgi:hypothetical protein
MYIQYFCIFGYFMEYITARSMPILFIVEYDIPWNTVFHGIRDIGILEEIGNQVESCILWNTAQDDIRYAAQEEKGPFRGQPCPTDLNTSNCSR